MKNISKTIIAIVLSSFVFVACNNDDDYNNNQPTPITQLNVKGVGTSVGQVKNIVNPKTGEIVEAFCFLMDLVDAETGEVLGTLEDCDIGTEEFEDGSLLSQVITVYNFTGKGTITSLNEVLQTPLANGNFETSFTPTEDNIFDGTFDFEGVQGKVSVSGEVDLSQFDNNIIIFDCGFTINLN